MKIKFNDDKNVRSSNGIIISSWKDWVAEGRVQGEERQGRGETVKD